MFEVKCGDYVFLFVDYSFDGGCFCDDVIVIKFNDCVGIKFFSICIWSLEFFFYNGLDGIVLCIECVIDWK